MKNIERYYSDLQKAEIQVEQCLCVFRPGTLRIMAREFGNGVRSPHAVTLTERAHDIDLSPTSFDMQAAKKTAREAVEPILRHTHETLVSARVGQWSVGDLARYVKTVYWQWPVTLTTERRGRATLQSSTTVGSAFKKPYGYQYPEPPPGASVGYEDGTDTLYRVVREMIMQAELPDDVVPNFEFEVEALASSRELLPYAAFMRKFMALFEQRRKPFLIRGEMAAARYTNGLRITDIAQALLHNSVL